MQPVLLATGVYLVAGFLLRTDAQAQTIPAKDMARCAAVTPDQERLACYDQLAHGDPVAGSTPAALPPAHPEQNFGITKRILVKPSGPSRIEAKVAAVATNAHGETVVGLDNHQTWTVLDGPALLDAGAAIAIKRAALGSFLMTTPSGRVYRVERQQ